MSQKNLQKAIELTKKNQPNVAIVFDLDSTLFCMKYRTQAIINDYIQQDSFVAQSSLREKMQSIEVTKKDWSIEEILKRYDLDKNEQLLKRLAVFWRKTFFTNDYLHYDQPYSGSIPFVKHLNDLGGIIFYLTARNLQNMEEGTLSTLKKYNCPLKTKEHLILKSNREQSDAEYKTEELKKLSQQFKTILFFENEPVILNLVNQTLKDIHLFWMNSTHSGKANPPKIALPISTEYEF